MSVMIRGMEMPNDCRECPMQVYCSPGKTLCKSADMVLAENYKPIPFDGRPKWCPLVELPEKHGRLIDADKLKLEYPHNLDWEYPVTTNSEACETIDKQPTVIEAEDE